MLKSFLYLNEKALADYVSALEGGLRSSIDDRRTDSSGVSGKSGVGGFGAGGESAHETERTVAMTDSPPAQFERLMRLAAADPEAAGWVEVLEPDSDFPELLTGALIDIECEIRVPNLVSLLNSNSGILDTIKALSALSEFMPEGTKAIDPKQIAAMETMTNVVGDKLTIVGTPDSDEWRIAGTILPSHLRVESEDLEGDVRVVGKVKKRIRRGESHSLIALPGASMMSRAQRREMDRKNAKQGGDEARVVGPALVLDILAIYR